MRCYSLTGTDTNTANTTQVGLTGGTGFMPRIYFLAIGSVATPADNAWEFFLQRYTAAGTSTASTPEPLNPNDGACTATAGTNHSVEPTYTANKVLLRIASNMRPGFMWHAVGPEQGLWIPPTAANGIGLLSNAIGGSAAAYSYTIHFAE